METDFNKAADWLEAHDLLQNGYYINDDEDKACIYGCLFIAQGIDAEDHFARARVIEETRSALHKVLIERGVPTDYISVTQWSDHHATKEEAVEVLREAANV